MGIYWYTTHIKQLFHEQYTSSGIYTHVGSTPCILEL